MGNVEEDRAPLETNKNALMQETNKQQIERENKDKVVQYLVHMH